MAINGKPLGDMVISLSLDGTNFGNTLDSINRQVKMAESTMKANMKILGRAGKSYDGLSTKAKDYERVIETQKKKVEELSRRHKESSDAIGEDADATMKLAEQVNNATGKLGAYENGLADIKKQMGQMSGGADTLAGKLDSVGTKLEDIGKKASAFGDTLSKRVTLPLMALFGGGVKNIIDFDSAKASVKKTVDMTEEEYEKLFSTIVDKSKNMPISAPDYSELVAEAGQLNISNDKLIDFTDTVVKLDVATDINKDEGATMLAQYANIVNMDKEKYSNLASAIVWAGNNSATSEKPVMDLMMRLAGQSSQIGLSEADMVGLSTAMSASGINAEAGGSAMSNIMKKMQVAVDMGGDQLNGFANVAGMSAESFAEAFKADPMSAIQAFIDGLSKASANGENLTLMLKDLGITGIRESDVLLRLAGNNDLLRDAVVGTNEAYAENTALGEEADVRFESLASRIETLKNRFMDFTRQIASYVMPHVEKFMDWTEGLMKKFDGLDEKTKENIVTFGLFAMALGPVLKVVGLILSPVGTLIKNTPKFLGFFKAGESGVSGFGKAFKLMTGPIGITIGIVLALIATFVILYKKSETFRNLVDSIVEKIKLVVEVIKIFGQAIIDLFKGDTEGGTKLLKKLGLNEDQIAKITGAVDSIKKTLSDLWDAVKQVFKGIGDVFMGLLKGDFTRFWKGVKNIFSGGVKFVWTLMRDSFVGKIVASIVGMVKDIPTKIKDMFKNIVKGIVNGSRDAVSDMNKFKNNMIQKAVDMKDGMIKKLKELVNWVKDMPKKMGDGLVKGTKALKDSAKKMGNGLIGGVEWAVNKAVGGVNWVLDKVGAKARVSKWKAPKFAKGTPKGGHKGGLAHIGDGGMHELVVLPGGKSFMSPKTDTLVNLPQGTEVVSGPKTKTLFGGNVPKFAKGSGGFFDDMITGAKDSFNKVKDWTVGIWDWVKDKASIKKLLLGQIGDKLPSQFTGGITQDVMKGGIHTIAEGAKDWLFGQAQDMMGGSDVSDSVDGQTGVYAYLANFARQVAKKFNMQITSGYRQGSLNEVGQLDDHGKRQAIDIARPDNDYGIYKKAGDYITGNPFVKYVIANNRWSQASNGWKWQDYPYGGHADHIHISGVEPSKGGNSGGSSRWSGQLASALKANGLPSSPEYMNAWLRQIQSESGGNPNAVQHGYTDINTLTGNLARGLLQVIPPTFQAHKHKGHDNIMNPMDNMLSAIAYAKSRYGAKGMLQVIGNGHGYENGGLVEFDQLTRVGEGNRPEMIIPLSRQKRSRGLQLLNQASTIMGVGSKVGNQEQEKNQLAQLTALLGATLEQNKLLQEQNQHLQKIYEKDTSVVIGDKDIHESNKRYGDKENFKLNIARGSL